VLNRDILVAHLFCALFRLVERRIQVLRNVDLIGARPRVVGRKSVDLSIRFLTKTADVRACSGEDAADQPVRLRDQGVQHVRLRYLCIFSLAGDLLCVLHSLNAFLC
jgi:hypothetical protein